MLTNQDLDFIGVALNRAAVAFTNDAAVLDDATAKQEKRQLVLQAVYALKLANQLQEQMNVIRALNNLDTRNAYSDEFKRECVDGNPS